MVMLIITGEKEGKRGGFSVVFEGTEWTVHTLHIPECVFDVTRFVSPVGDGGSPTIWVGAFIVDILRDLTTREPPEGYLCIVPEHNEYAATISVEGCTSTSVEVFDSASSVASGTTSTLGAKRISVEVRSGVHITYSASSVEGVLVGPVSVDVLHDVDLVRRRTRDQKLEIVP